MQSRALSIASWVVLLLACVAIAADPTTATATQPARQITFKLGNGSENWPPEMRERIVASMTEAVALYNKHGEFDKVLTAHYSPSVPTADGNYNGSIRFGNQYNTRVALHEIGHTLGIGQHPKWNDFIKDGKWTGEHALKQLREFDGPDAVLHADHQHFWPYGLNFDKEGGDENSIKHVKMVAAFQRDLGIVK